MNKKETNKTQSGQKNSTQNIINYDYDWNTEYGDGDIPDIDKPRNSTKDQQRESLTDK